MWMTELVVYQHILKWVNVVNQHNINRQHLVSTNSKYLPTSRKNGSTNIPGVRGKEDHSLTTSKWMDNLPTIYVCNRHFTYRLFFGIWKNKGNTLQETNSKEYWSEGYETWCRLPTRDEYKTALSKYTKSERITRRSEDNEVEEKNIEQAIKNAAWKASGKRPSIKRKRYRTMS